MMSLAHQSCIGNVSNCSKKKEGSQGRKEERSSALFSWTEMQLYNLRFSSLFSFYVFGDALTGLRS